MLWKKGFTMVELLVVLIILAILVAVAAPMYFGNVERAKASEAVAAMGTIRQALRDYRVSHGSYPTADITNITLALPTGAGVDLEATQYFSNAAYQVDFGGSFASGATPAALDFVIKVTGADSVAYDATAKKGAVKNGEIADFLLEMDNTGRVFVSYKAVAAGEPRIWAAY